MIIISSFGHGMRRDDEIYDVMYIQEIVSIQYLLYHLLTYMHVTYHFFLFPKGVDLESAVVTNLIILFLFLFV